MTMKNRTCSYCNEPLETGVKVCSYCGQPVPDNVLSSKCKQLPLAGKLAAAGGVIFVPSFLFNLGTDAMLLGVALIGIGFLLYLFKIGT